MSKIDLQSSQWCRIIFEARNKEYGAYVLRKDYSRNALKALIIAVFFLGLVCYAPILATAFEKRTAIADRLPDDETRLSALDIEQPRELPPPPVKLPPPPAVKEIKFTEPEIVPQDELREDELPPAADAIPDDVLLGDETKEGLSKFEVPIDVPEDGEGKELITGQVTEQTYPFASIETKPMFPGGMDKLLPYITKNFNYPARAIENNIQGTVFVQFTIDKDGSIIDAKAVRGQELGGGLAEEALRVVKGMPRWQPGEQNGQKVKVSYTLPVAVRLQR